MKTNIVGTAFRKVDVQGMEIGQSLTIDLEPDNPYDVDALAVYWNNLHIGYIGKKSDVYDLNRKDFPLSATIIDFYIKDEDDLGFEQFDVGNLVKCTLEIATEKEVVKVDKPNFINSFNENIEVDFNEHDHVYTYKGKHFIGVTTYIKRYIKDFNTDVIADKCVVYWGLQKNIILDAWNLIGDVGRHFGTGVHKALEYEDLYRKYLKKNNKDRCFIIKQPAIKKIVDDFFAFYDTLGFKGDIMPEALVTDVDKGICGLADRILILDWDKKICRIQDYKINHSFNKKGQETFINLPEGLILPTTKLSKLALQLKVHAQMLEKAGWTIDGCDGFVYEDKWEYYEVDMLKGFHI